MRIPTLALALLAVACGSSTGAGDGATSPSDDAGLPNDCAGVAARICRASVRCGGSGTAKVTLSAASSGIAYASEAYCAMIFTTQCGPSSPASDVPRVADPAGCGGALGVATCSGDALLLPQACGGS